MVGTGHRSHAINQELSPTRRKSGPPDVKAFPVSREAHPILRNTGVSIHQSSQLLSLLQPALNNSGQMGDHHQRIVKPGRCPPD